MSDRPPEWLGLVSVCYLVMISFLVVCAYRGWVLIGLAQALSLAFVETKVDEALEEWNRRRRR